MRYIKFHRHYASPDEPVLLYGELDAEHREVRKVEVYRDGRHELACDYTTTGSASLGDNIVMVAFEEFVIDPDFELTEISKEEFEEVWNRNPLPGGEGE
jgi:hypothetical protein